MVMVSNLPTLPTPFQNSTDVAIVSRNNQLYKVDFQTLFDNTAPTIDPSTINHDDLANINALEHIDWTNTNQTLATTGLVISSNISGTNTGDQDLFNRVSILGALPTTDLVATSPTDTITFVAGQNIQLSSDNTTNQITISSTGGGGALPTPIAIDKVTYDPDGVQTSFALPASVDNEGSVLVFFDGVYQGQDSYNFVGAAPFSTITFVDPLNVPTAPFASIDKLTIFTYNEDDLELVRESFTDGVDYTSGTTTNLTLPVTPNSEDDVVIFFDGGFVNRSSYSVAGPIITFNDPILLNTDKVDVIVFVDTGPGGVDVDLDRRVYEAGIDFVPGLTSLLALPANIEAEEDLLVFFDGSYIGNESYDGLNSLISFNDPIPVFTNRIDIITLNGGAAAAIDPNSFGIIQVAGQADVNAIVPTDALTFLAGSDIEILTDDVSREITFNFVGTVGDPDQNLFQNVQINSAPAFSASTTTDTIDFVAGTNVTITNPSGNTIQIDAAGGGGGGEANTASSSGLGESLVLPKVGVDLPFKGISNGDTNITIGSNATDVLVSINTAVLEGNLNHDNLTGFVSNEHIDWTAATQNLSTTGTVGSSNYDATGSVAAGSTNSGTNTGDQNLFSTVAVLGQSDVVADTTSDTLTLVAGTNITLTTDPVTDSVTIAAAGGGAGEANTASNQGGHNELFIQKTGVDLEFRTVTSGDTSLSFTQNPQDLDIQVNEAAVDHDSLLNFVANEHIDWTSATQNISTTGTISGSNVSGTNTGDQNLWATVTGDVGSTTANTLTDTLTIAGGTNITTTIVGDTLTIDSAAGAGEANTASNQGGASEWFIQKTGVDLEFRTFQSTGGSLSITTNPQNLDVVVNEAAVDHDALLNFVANEHIDWTAATQNLSTTGTIGSSNYSATGSVAAGSANSGTNTGDQNLWESITADVGATLTPNIATDTLNFVGGTNITITSDGVDTLTFDSTGGGGGVSLQGSQVFLASGTWNRPVGITQVKVRVIGAGGGGGGAQASAGGGGTRVASAGGGAAGGYTEEIIDVSGTASASVTIGAGGAGGASNGGNGGTGGTTSFDAFCSATGGGGGLGTGAAAADGTSTLGGLTPGIGVNGDFNFNGNCGTTARNSPNLNAGGGNGGGSPLGAGGGAGGFSDGVTVLGPVVGTNGGGGGGAADRGGGGQAGAAGGNGIVIVEEYG